MFAAFVKPPVPASAAETVRIPLFVRVTPVIVIFGILTIPFIDWEFVVKLYMPVPAVKVPLFVIPPLNIKAELPELFHVPPAFIVKSPLKVFVPVLLAKIIVPSARVVPVIVIVDALNVFVVPEVTDKFVPTL